MLNLLNGNETLFKKQISFTLFTLLFIICSKVFHQHPSWPKIKKDWVKSCCPVESFPFQVWKNHASLKTLDSEIPCPNYCTHLTALVTYQDIKLIFKSRYEIIIQCSKLRINIIWWSLYKVLNILGLSLQKISQNSINTIIYRWKKK